MEDVSQIRFDRHGRERYLLIHKRPVGPKTADRLFLLYEELSQVQMPREMYQAGWAAAEISLIRTEADPDYRVQMAQAAIDCWEYALELEHERAAKSAFLKDKSADTTGEYRIASTLAVAPVLKAIPYGKPDKDLLRSSHQKLLEVAESNCRDMVLAEGEGMSGRVGSHIGLGFEHVTQLAFNRLISARIIAMPSLARSDTGMYYPQQTHDLQVLSLHGGEVQSVTPLEVKARLRNAFYERYQAALVGGRTLAGNDSLSLQDAVSLFRQEVDGGIDRTGLSFLEQMTDSVIHSLRHYHQADKFGRHCLNFAKCQLPQQRHASQSMSSVA